MGINIPVNIYWGLLSLGGGRFQAVILSPNKAHDARTKKPARGGRRLDMLKLRETTETITGFGVRYRITRRTWLLFGILPVAWSETTERY